MRTYKDYIYTHTCMQRNTLMCIHPYVYVDVDIYVSIDLCFVSMYVSCMNVFMYVGT